MLGRDTVVLQGFARPGGFLLPEPWVSVEEVARHLGVSKDTIYRWAEAQRIPARKVGRFREGPVALATADTDRVDAGQRNTADVVCHATRGTLHTL